MNLALLSKAERTAPDDEGVGGRGALALYEDVVHVHVVVGGARRRTRVEEARVHAKHVTCLQRMEGMKGCRAFGWASRKASQAGTPRGRILGWLQHTVPE